MRLGVLVPAGNPTIEPELYRLAPAGLSIHFARLDTLAGEPGGVDGMERRTLAYLDSLPAASHRLAAVKPDAVVLAHTAVSYLNGHAGEPKLLERLRALAGPRAFTAAAAIRAALQHLGARRIALATPYPESISAAARAFWEAAGHEIVSHRRIDTPNIYEETEATAHDLACAADVPTADTILISGTGLPTIGVVERLERELGKPVVTSQIATLWHALQVLGLETPVPGHGQLLSGTTRT
jgi:maleate cis-trans isomerase